MREGQEWRIGYVVLCSWLDKKFQSRICEDAKPSPHPGVGAPDVATTVNSEAC